jgi:MFS transporter, ACS family, aldohexuronate transporter
VDKAGEVLQIPPHPNPLPEGEGRIRSGAWKWWVCGMLLLASAINYMDRQTLANAAVRITTQFHLNEEQYGNIEAVFGWAFAVGSLVFGLLADRVAVKWLYPAVLVLWSGAGVATGSVHSYHGLLACRGLLGLFEAGHWPCAIRTTRQLLAPRDRALGNSVLQSGTSIGAVVAPLVMSRLLTAEISSWRYAFQLVGLIGFVWVIGWFALVRGRELSAPAVEKRGGTGWKVLFGRRMLIVLFMIACINTAWQLLRAWLPKFLQEGRGYTERDTLYFTAVFYVVTDVGCIVAGAAVLWLHRRGMSVHGARLLAFFACAVAAALTTVAAVLPHGWLLLGLLLAVGAGALGVFPVYHAFTQDISGEHQGMVTGLAGVAGWAVSAPAQTLFGRRIDQTGSFDLGLAVAGWLPVLAFLAVWALWGRRKSDEATNTP